MRRLIVVRMVSDGSQELVFARACWAVGEIRSQACVAGTAGTEGLTGAGIEREIREVRRARSRSRPMSDAPAGETVARP